MNDRFQFYVLICFLFYLVISGKLEQVIDVLVKPPPAKDENPESGEPGDYDPVETA